MTSGSPSLPVARSAVPGQQDPSGEPGPPDEPDAPLRADQAAAAHTRRRTLSVWRAAAILPGALVAVLALIGSWLPHTPPGRIVAAPYARAGHGLWLGADSAGRDVLAQVLCGGRALVLIPVAATLTTAVLGCALGVPAGYFGGRVRRVLAVVEDVLIALPPVLVLLTLLDGWGYSAWSLITAVALTGVPIVSRVARSATAQVRHLGFVDQAVALGDGPGTVMVREILPNIIGVLLADAGARLAVAITLTASAGFLGFGPDTPNWGSMVSANIEGISLSPWGVLVPAALLALLTIGANLSLDLLAARFEA